MKEDFWVNLIQILLKRKFRIQVELPQEEKNNPQEILVPVSVLHGEV